ncbi:MAG TPA: tetratricopeptide repeat protein [Bryobacteraceae bacterium]|nr:tetratricopeptide repeat protein [Bryobacteraceae bacterium]
MKLELIPAVLTGALVCLGAPPEAWLKARDMQDRAALDAIAAEARKGADARPKSGNALYQAALAQSLRSEVALEMRDKRAAGSAAEEGIELARRALAMDGSNAEYHRMLGTLCGQVIPANVLLGLRYGQCALDEVSKAIELNPKSSPAWLSRGVGNYYLPESFGGGPVKAVEDMKKAIALDAKNAEAHMWLGIALRKLKRNAEARSALEASVKLNPRRTWAKQQLEKTPPK